MIGKEVCIGIDKTEYQVMRGKDLEVFTNFYNSFLIISSPQVIVESFKTIPTILYKDKIPPWPMVLDLNSSMITFP